MRETIRKGAFARGAVSISLVGSVARGEDLPGSDVDFVCRFGDDFKLWNLGGMTYELSLLLDCDVDVCPERYLESPYDSMLGDAITL